MAKEKTPSEIGTGKNRGPLFSISKKSGAPFRKALLPILLAVSLAGCGNMTAERRHAFRRMMYGIRHTWAPESRRPLILEELRQEEEDERERIRQAREDERERYRQAREDERERLRQAREDARQGEGQ